MMTVFASLALASVLSLPAATSRQSEMREAGPLARAVAAASHSPAPAPSPARTLQNGSRDSLKNGAIIGAIAGGVLGAVGGATGCGLGEILDSFEASDDSCAGPTLVGAVIGAGLGSLLGAGVDVRTCTSPRPWLRRTTYWCSCSLALLSCRRLSQKPGIPEGAALHPTKSYRKKPACAVAHDGLWV